MLVSDYGFLLCVARIHFLQAVKVRLASLKTLLNLFLQMLNDFLLASCFFLNSLPFLFQQPRLFGEQFLQSILLAHLLGAHLLDVADVPLVLVLSVLLLNSYLLLLLVQLPERFPHLNCEFGCLLLLLLLQNLPLLKKPLLFLLQLLYSQLSRPCF